MLFRSYTTAWALAEFADRLLSRMTDVYFSMLSRREEEESRTAIHQKVSRKFVFFVMPLMMFGILLAPLAIRILYKAEFHAAQILFALLMARQMIRTLGLLHFQYLLVRGEVHLATRCYLAAFVVQIATYIPLIVYYGAEGMCWASIISTSTYVLLQGSVFIRRGQMTLLPFALTLFWMGLGIFLVISQPWIMG